MKYAAGLLVAVFVAWAIGRLLGMEPEVALYAGLLGGAMYVGDALDRRSAK